ncbi:MAG TPA: endonuclease MutS2, partial [Edaphobacter sp.]
MDVPFLQQAAPVPSPLAESSAAALEWPRLRDYLSTRTWSPLGKAWVLALEPSQDLAWIEAQQQRTAEMRSLYNADGSFDFHGLFDPADLLEKARIEGSALEALEILALLTVVERINAWRKLITTPQTNAFLLSGDSSTQPTASSGNGIAKLSLPIRDASLEPLLKQLSGRIEPDGSLSDDASPELRRIRRAMEQQHRAIEESLRRALNRLAAEGSTQDAVITIRGDRFVIPVRSEFKRRVPGVVHGSSSTGQTVFVEPLETIEQNNELVRLLDEEQSEIHRILVAMTRSLAADAPTILAGAIILAEIESHAARARFAKDLNCARPIFAASAAPRLSLTNARHPLLELRMLTEARAAGTEPKQPTPLTVALEDDARQLIISGPNTGGKTVSLKTIGLLSLMAQAGVPVPADEAVLPLFTAVYADIGDAQSIERNLSSFSAHVVNLDRISREATNSSLVLLDELGSATDPEEGAALAVAVSKYFLDARVWSCITTHLTSLKIYAANNPGVLNAAVGFDQETLTPTYKLRLGVPGASAGLNIASRLGLSPEIIAAARAQLSTQTADIAAFLDRLHQQLAAVNEERIALAQKEEELRKQKILLDLEGRAEVKQRTRELEKKLDSLLNDFDAQLRESVKAIGDKAVARRLQRDSATTIARARREFGEQFKTTVTEHMNPAKSST